MHCSWDMNSAFRPMNSQWIVIFLLFSIFIFQQNKQYLNIPFCFCLYCFFFLSLPLILVTFVCRAFLGLWASRSHGHWKDKSETLFLTKPLEPHMICIISSSFVHLCRYKLMLLIFYYIYIYIERERERFKLHLCNSIRVTPFLSHRFPKDLTVKKKTS